MQVIPNDQTSTFPSYCPSSMARMTSGAIQYGVPTKLLAGQCKLAEPKSATKKIQMSEFNSEWQSNGGIPLSLLRIFHFWFR